MPSALGQFKDAPHRVCAPPAHCFNLEPCIQNAYFTLYRSSESRPGVRAKANSRLQAQWRAMALRGPARSRTAHANIVVVALIRPSYRIRLQLACQCFMRKAPCLRTASRLTIWTSLSSDKQHVQSNIHSMLRVNGTPEASDTAPSPDRHKAVAC